MLLNEAQLRDRVKEVAQFSSETVQDMLDAAELAINQRYGELGNVTEILWGGSSSVLFLKRQPAAIVSIDETTGDTTTTLDPTDYLIDGRVLRRLYYGINPADFWGARAVVVYTPIEDTDERKRVQAELCKLDATSKPGLSSYTTGAHSETYAGAGQGGKTYKEQREEILASLVSVEEPLFA
jgi:hypothetical protein